MSAFRCVRRGRRVESAAVMDARRLWCSWMEGSEWSSIVSEGLMLLAIEGGSCQGTRKENMKGMKKNMMGCCRRGKVLYA